MEHYLPANSTGLHFLPMMVRALARGSSGGEIREALERFHRFALQLRRLIPSL